MAIVYRDEELDKALMQGLAKITLCAGVFNIRKASCVIFDKIGPVKVYVDYTREQAEKREIRFIDIYPAFKETDEEQADRPVLSSIAMSYNGSYASGSGFGDSRKILGYGINLI